MTIKTIPVGVMTANCYFLINEANKQTVIVDPGDDYKKLVDYIEGEGLDPQAIILTHGHFDHIFAVNELRDKYRIPLFLHAQEAELAGSDLLNVSARVRRACIVTADTLVKDQEEYELAGERFIFIHTPGHTAGSMCIYLPGSASLITGDTLFYMGIGRSDLPTGDEDAILTSIADRLFSLPEDTVCYPGHGQPTSIGFEKVNNPYIR